MYLNCKTHFSFLYGTFSTKELVQTAVENGVTSLALTNINSTCDLWDFVKLCREVHIKPVVGVEFRNGDKLLYILIAANNKGLSWIHSFLSEHLLEKNKGKTVSALTYFINRKHLVTKYNDEMFFETFVDAALNWIDTVHFPEVARNFPLHDSGFYRITGKVAEDFGVFSIEVRKMEKVGHKRRIYENLGWHKLKPPQNCSE